MVVVRGHRELGWPKGPKAGEAPFATNRERERTARGVPSLTSSSSNAFAPAATVATTDGYAERNYQLPRCVLALGYASNPTRTHCRHPHPNRPETRRKPIDGRKRRAEERHGISVDLRAVFFYPVHRWFAPWATRAPFLCGRWGTALLTFSSLQHPRTEDSRRRFDFARTASFLCTFSVCRARRRGKNCPVFGKSKGKLPGDDPFVSSPKLCQRMVVRRRTLGGVGRSQARRECARLFFLSLILCSVPFIRRDFGQGFFSARVARNMVAPPSTNQTPIR